MYDDYFKSIIGGSIKSPEYYDTTYDNRTYEPRQVNALAGYNYSSSQMQEKNGFEEENKLMDLYPDIYKVVTPMVDKLLEGKDINNLDETKLVNWTVEIYDALEVDEAKQAQTSPTNNSSMMSNSASSSSMMSNSANTSSMVNSSANSGSMINSLANNNSMPKNQSTVVGNDAVSRTATSNVRNVNNSVKMEENKINEPKTIEVASRYRNYKNPVLRDLIRILILERLGKNQKPPRPRARPYDDFRPNFMPIPDYRNANADVFKPYTNYSKTYFDVPYPEE